MKVLRWVESSGPTIESGVELIAAQPNGILTLLDAEAMNPHPSDTNLLRALHSKHSKHPHFPRPHPKDMEHMFIVRRFAGAVSYTIGSFIDKNNDSIPADMSNRFSGSSNTLIPAFFQQDPTLAVQVREN